MTPQRLGRLFVASMLIVLLIVPTSRLNADGEKPSEPVVRAESAVLIDAGTGAVLYGMNAEKQLFPASITKIVTGIVAIESASNLGSPVKISKEARNEQGTRVYLAEGEEQTLENLLYGMLVNSGNDAATAIAEHLAGSKERFAEQMNAFVRDKVGVSATRFTNPSGLPDPEQVTTASDMAKIARYAMQNETFRTIVGTRKRPWTGKEWTSELVNHNRLLGTYEGATGIKNGYTAAAGFTLVASAKRNDMEFIGVILKASVNGAMYADMTKLLDYGFAAFEQRKLFESGETYVASGQEGQGDMSFVASAPIWTVVPKGETPEVLVDSGGRVSVRTSLGVHEAGELEAQSEDRSALLPESTEREPAGSEPEQKKNGVAVMAGVLCLMMLAYLGFAAAKLRAQRERSRGKSTPFK